MPRVGVNYRVGDDAVLRAAYARFMMPVSNVRDTLGDFVNQYTGYAQMTTTLPLINGAPRQRLADPFPATVNPVIEPYGQSYGRYTGLGSAVSLDEYELRPQINDRFNFSFQKQVWGGTIVEASYFFNWGTRVPYDVNLNMADPSFRYEQKALLNNTTFANPFRNYLTPDKFPGQARNTANVTLGSFARSVSAVREHHADQHQRPSHQGAHDRAARAAAVHARDQLPRCVRLRQCQASGVVRRSRAIPGPPERR